MTEQTHPTDVIVGSNIRRIRKARGMSQTALGEALGITFQQIQKYERGANRVSASAIDMMCLALGCSLNDIFAGTAATGMKPLALPQYSPRSLELAALFDQVDSDETKAAIFRLLRSVTPQEEAQAEAA